MSPLTRGIRPKSPPFSKGGPGGISEICYHFSHNFISNRLQNALWDARRYLGGIFPCLRRPFYGDSLFTSFY